MNETVLRDFFLGKAGAADLSNDLRDEIAQLNQTFRTFYICSLKEKFWIDRKMLVQLCDSVVAGELTTAALVPIAFAIYTSDQFEWEEDDVISSVLMDWSCPEINYPLTTANLERCKRWLLGIEPITDRPDVDQSSPPGRLVSRTQRIELT